MALSYRLGQRHRVQTFDEQPLISGTHAVRHTVRVGCEREPQRGRPLVRGPCSAATGPTSRTMRPVKSLFTRAIGPGRLGREAMQEIGVARERAHRFLSPSARGTRRPRRSVSSPVVVKNPAPVRRPDGNRVRFGLAARQDLGGGVAKVRTFRSVIDIVGSITVYTNHVPSGDHEPGTRSSRPVVSRTWAASQRRHPEVRAEGPPARV